ncbi:tektin-2-like [Aplochiton taeniatus]
MELHQQLTLDLDNKVEALNVDLSCLSLTEYSPEISLKPNPTCVPNGSSSHQEWERFTQSNMARAEREMQASRQLRDTITRDRSQRQTDLRAQRIDTEFGLRKRAHQLQQACGELRWQQKATREEILALERDIHLLRQALTAKESPLKLVHTRLEKRSRRPETDLCRDQVQSQLVEETKNLETTMERLEEKLAQTIHTLQCLEQHQAHMEEDMHRKQQALELELRSIEVRLRLNSLPTPRFIPGVSESFPLQESMALTGGIH